MGRKKQKPTPDNDVRMRTLLAALVFCPYAGTHVVDGVRAFQSRDFKKAAPIVFARLWPSKTMAGHQISTVARMLKHRGFLVEAGRRNAKWFNVKARREEDQEVDYMSPSYALTEQGLAWVLTNCNLRRLVPIKHPAADIAHHSRINLGIWFETPRVNEWFIDFACIRQWLDNPGWGEHRYEFFGDM